MTNDYAGALLRSYWELVRGSDIPPDLSEFRTGFDEGLRAAHGSDPKPFRRLETLDEEEEI